MTLPHNMYHGISMWHNRDSDRRWRNERRAVVCLLEEAVNSAFFPKLRERLAERGVVFIERLDFE